MGKPIRQWDHDELANDLAASLHHESRMVWTNMQLGPSGSPRPDVYTIERSFANPRPTAYECKISVADFRSDVTSGKWTAYQNYAHSVIFAAPAGLVAKDDVPQACGLILRHENAWRTARRAIVNPRAIPEEAWVKLLIDGVEREGPKFRAKAWHQHDIMRGFAERFGADAALYVAGASKLRAEVEQAKSDIQSMKDLAQKDAEEQKRKFALDAPLQWRALTRVLELPDTADEWAVRHAIAVVQREARAEGGPEARALRGVISQLRGIVNTHSALADGKDAA